VRPEILVMDEMIGVGDQSFIEKAHKRITELLNQARILVLASHSVSIIEKFCTKALWLEKGRIKRFGTTADVLEAYTNSELRKSYEDSAASA